jgi:hypothetical protein
VSLERTPCHTVDPGNGETWSKKKENAMRRNLLVPALAFGVALSGSAFGQSWTKSTTTNLQSQANTYGPNTYDQQKARAEARQSSAVTSQPNSIESSRSTSAKMTSNARRTETT